MVSSSRSSLLAAILASASTAAAFSMQMNYKHRYGNWKQTWPASFSDAVYGKGAVPMQESSVETTPERPFEPTTTSASSLPTDLLNVVGDPYPPQPAVSCYTPQAVSAVWGGDPTKNVPMQVSSLWGTTRGGSAAAYRHSIDPVVDPSAPAAQYDAAKFRTIAEPMAEPVPEPELMAEPMPDLVEDVVGETVKV